MTCERDIDSYSLLSLPYTSSPDLPPLVARLPSSSLSPILKPANSYYSSITKKETEAVGSKLEGAIKAGLVSLPSKRMSETEGETCKRAKIEPVTRSDGLGDLLLQIEQTPNHRKVSLKEAVSKRLKTALL